MIVCIDGSIGVGKSSVLSELRSRGHVVYQEGVARWSHILQKFYENPKRWCFTLQMSILKDMHSQYMDILNSWGDSKLVFIERCPISALVFIKNSKNLGYISEEELELYNSYSRILAWEPHKTIHLTAPVDVCLSRIKQRSRKGENDIDLEYLKALHDRYSELPGERLHTERSISDVTDEILRILAS